MAATVVAQVNTSTRQAEDSASGDGGGADAGKIAVHHHGGDRPLQT